MELLIIVWRFGGRAVRALPGYARPSGYGASKRRAYAAFFVSFLTYTKDSDENPNATC